MSNQHCRSDIVECYKSNDSFDKVERYFNIVAVSGNDVERVFREISSFRQSWNRMNMPNLLNFVERTIFHKNLFDIVAQSPLPLTDPRDAEAQCVLNIPCRIVW